MPIKLREPHLMTGRSPDTPILVALSGGADSVALLCALREYAAAHGTPLRAAHVNHGIRGEEAVRDRDFCVALAARWDIPISVLNADVPALREARGGSMEEVARQVRYEFFEQVMAEYHIPLLATAHHADDQLETVLLRLARGTGPDGLCGIPPIRALGEGRLVIRPLLSCEKAELVRFCRERGLDFVTDSTNDDISYARNRIRREVIPHLRAINPSVTEAAARLTESLRADASCLSAQTDDAARELMRVVPLTNGAVRVTLACAPLRLQPEAVRRRLLVRAMKMAGCPQPEEHFVARLCDAALSERGRLSLPGRIEALVECGTLTLSPSDAQPCAPCEELEVDLSDLPKTVVFGDTRLTFSDIPPRMEEKAAENENVYNLCMNTALNFDKIKGRPVLRTRRPGDLFLWRGHHRKVKKLLCDTGVPCSVRDRLPLLCDGEGIVLIPGIGVRDGAAAQTDARPLYVSIAPFDPMMEI